MWNRILLLPLVAAMMQRRADAQAAAEAAARALLRTHGSQAYAEARRRAQYAQNRRDRAKSDHWSKAALLIADKRAVAIPDQMAAALR